jgi:hypothetical protein
VIDLAIIVIGNASSVKPKSEKKRPLSNTIKGGPKCSTKTMKDTNERVAVLLWNYLTIVAVK